LRFSDASQEQQLFAFAFAALVLMLTTTSAIARNFGTAEEARAMLDRAVIVLKSDEPKALREFNDPDNKEFHDRDLYVSCFNISDGNFTAAPPGMLGMDIRTFKVGDDPRPKSLRCNPGYAARKHRFDGLQFSKGGQARGQAIPRDSHRRSGLRRLLLQIIAAVEGYAMYVCGMCRVGRRTRRGLCPAPPPTKRACNFARSLSIADRMDAGRDLIKFWKGRLRSRALLNCQVLGLGP
jgi:hypothetical protein